MIPTMELVDNWQKWYLSMGHSLPSTLTYYSFISRFVKMNVEINQKTVDKFREKKGHMCSPCSGGLRSFFFYLVRKHDYPDEILNLRYDKNKNHRKLPQTLTWNETQLLLNNMPSLKLKVMVLFTFELALRLSETLKIKWEDLNWTEWLPNREEYGVVTLKNTKRNKFRKIPVKPKLMSLLYELSTKNEKGYPYGSVVFNFGIESFIGNKERSNEKNLFDYIDFAGNKFEIEVKRVGKRILGKHVTPHMLRHSKAQILLDNGMSLESLKEFLGHDDISTTQIYAQASPTKVKRELIEFDIYKDIDAKMLQDRRYVEPFVVLDDIIRSFNIYSSV